MGMEWWKAYFEGGRDGTVFRRAKRDEEHKENLERVHGLRETKHSKRTSSVFG